MTTATPDLAALLAQLAHVLADQKHEPPKPSEPRPMPQRVLLTVKEAAAQLGIGQTLMWHLVGTRQIESVQIGRLRRVPVAAIHEYAARLVDEQTAKRLRKGGSNGTH